MYNTCMHRHHFIIRFFVVTIIFGSMYGLLHVMNRSLANDMPQLLATQAAKQLDAGLGLSSINMGATDLANNPVPFVVVYDKKEKAVAGSGYLDRKLAQMPRGVVQHATAGKPHAVTWAPGEGIRIASVTVAAKDYYVAGGQSLKMTENRSLRLLWYTLAAYLLTIVIMVAVKFCQCQRCRLARQMALTHSGDGGSVCACGCAVNKPSAAIASAERTKTEPAAPKKPARPVRAKKPLRK